MNKEEILVNDFVYTEPILALNIKTGTWRKATDEEFPPETEYLGDAPIPMSGIYINNSEKTFFLYTVNEEKYFRDSDGTFIPLDGTVYATVEMSRDLAGNIEPDHNVFRLFRKDGQVLYIQRYDASLYRKLYETEMMIGVSAPVLLGELEPGDWDFFYNMIDACEYWEMKQQERQQAQQQALPSSTPAGQPCPRTGFWFTPAAPSSRQRFEQGQIMPDLRNPAFDTIWQWDDNQD